MSKQFQGHHASSKYYDSVVVRLPNGEFLWAQVNINTHKPNVKQTIDRKTVHIPGMKLIPISMKEQEKFDVECKYDFVPKFLDDSFMLRSFKRSRRLPMKNGRFHPPLKKPYKRKTT